MKERDATSFELLYARRVKKGDSNEDGGLEVAIELTSEASANLA